MIYPDAGKFEPNRTSHTRRGSSHTIMTPEILLVTVRKITVAKLYSQSRGIDRAHKIKSHTSD
jgi:hypothetical protein